MFLTWSFNLPRHFIERMMTAILAAKSIAMFKVTCLGVKNESYLDTDEVRCRYAAVTNPSLGNWSFGMQKIDPKVENKVSAQVNLRELHRVTCVDTFSRCIKPQSIKP